MATTTKAERERVQREMARDVVKPAPARVGGSSPSLAEMARDSGFSAAGHDELAPVLVIDGRAYR